MNTETLLVLIVIGLILLYLIYNNKNNCENLDTINTDVVSKGTKKENLKTLGVYYTNWCGYSQQFLSQMKNGLYKELENYVNINLVDCEKDETTKKQCTQLGIRGFPTIILHTEKENIIYDGDRSHDDLIQFVQHKL